MNTHESELGRVLRKYGVGQSINMSEAERRTGISRQTIAKWMRPVSPENAIRHTRVTLDAVADGLGIPRGELHHASQVDQGTALVPVDAGDDWYLSRLLEVEAIARSLYDGVTQLIALHQERRTLNPDDTSN